jgi:ParB family transcriptional regulator, chromosome partitioning protein
MVIGDVARPQEQVKKIALTTIVRTAQQPRKEFDEAALKELAASIKTHGVIQPIIVTPLNDGYRIIAGERRYRASQLAGKKDIPAIVRNHEELEELEIALVENVQRVDLSALEQAVAIVRLHDQFSLSYKQIAKKLGKAETTISNIVRLLQLPKQARDALMNGLITEGHARALLALKHDEKAQLSLLNDITKQRLSVRQAEQYVRQIKSPKPVNKASSPLLREQEKRVKNLFKGSRTTAVVQQTKAGTLQLKLTLTDVKALQQLLDKLER